EVLNRSFVRGNRVAMEGNGRFADQINQIQEAVRAVKRTVDAAFEALETRIEYVKEDISSREQLLTALRDSLPAQMNGYSTSLLSQIENQEDVDH
ncbi:hypothetical protein HDU77_001124, partial [Chytriomyces hyalinus]